MWLSKFKLENMRMTINWEMISAGWYQSHVDLIQNILVQKKHKGQYILQIVQTKLSLKSILDLGLH